MLCILDEVEVSLQDALLLMLETAGPTGGRAKDLALELSLRRCLSLVGVELWCRFINSFLGLGFLFKFLLFLLQFLHLPLLQFLRDEFLH